MAKSDYQKARLFAVYQILQRYTDDTHGLTKRQILERLEQTYEINSTRQTVDIDLALLEYPLGIHYDTTFEKPRKYSLTTRHLQYEDIKAISESVQENPFLPPVQKKRIIKDLKENLCSIHEAKEITLKALPYEETSIEEEIASLLETLDHAAEDKQIIKFTYPYFTFTKTHLARTDEEYKVLPLYTYSLNSKWYLCACKKVKPRYSKKTIKGYSEEDILCFEVNKILDLKLWRYTAEGTPMPAPAAVKEAVLEYDYSIEEIRTEKVSMEFDKELLPLIYERFGRDINIDKETDTTFHIVHETEVSSEFFSWIFSLGTGVKLLSPLYVTQRMKRWIQSLSDLYGLTDSSK